VFSRSSSAVSRRQASADDMELRPRFTDQLALAAVPTAICCVRMFVEVTLIKWGAAVVLDQALSVVTELVSHAVASTGVTEPRWWALGHLNLIKVRLLGLDTSIVIEVWDSDPSTAVRETPNLEARRWNYVHPRTGGKVAWCELDIPWRVSAWDEETQELPLSLPRRRPRLWPEPACPVVTEQDPELLRRVIEGLRHLDDASPGGGDIGY